MLLVFFGLTLNGDFLFSHTKVLDGITDFNEFRQGDERFSSIVKGMGHSSNINLRIACLQLTNAIISTPDDLDFRVHLRNEFWRAGLIDIVEVCIYKLSSFTTMKLLLFLASVVEHADGVKFFSLKIRLLHVHVRVCSQAYDRICHYCLF